MAKRYFYRVFMDCGAKNFEDSFEFYMDSAIGIQELIDQALLLFRRSHYKNLFLYTDVGDVLLLSVKKNKDGNLLVSMRNPNPPL